MDTDGKTGLILWERGRLDPWFAVSGRKLSGRDLKELFGSSFIREDQCEMPTGAIRGRSRSPISKLI